MTLKNSVLKISAGVSALAIWAGVPLAAFALPSWTTAVDVSTNGFATSDPEIAIDADGLMTAIWSHVGVSSKKIQASTSRDGQTWTDPVDVSPPSQEAIEPHLVVDGTGQATAIWTDTSGTDSVWTSKREWGEETWSDPVHVSADGENSGQAQIAVDSNYRFTVIFTNWDLHQIQVRTSTDGVSWDPIVTLAEEATSQYLRNPHIGVDGSGRVTGVWTAYDSANDYSMVVSRSSAERGVWSDATTLSELGTDSNEPQIAVTEDGLATATWRSDLLATEMQSRSSQSGGAWTASVGHGTGGGDKPKVSVAGSGTVVLTWVGDGILWASSSEDGVEWTAAQPVDNGEQASPSRRHVAKVIADSSGNLTAVWMHDYTGDPDYPYFRATVSTSSDGVTWSEPIELAGTSSYSVNVVVNAQCRVTALYELSDGTENTVQSRTLDNGGCSSGGHHHGGGSTPETLAFTGANDTALTFVMFGGVALIIAGGLVLRGARVVTHRINSAEAIPDSPA